MKLTFDIKDKPKFGQILVFALQQLLAILAATIAVPAAINGVIPGANMSQSAALFGAGVGTIVYLLFTKFKSPVFLGSSFAFIKSMLAAFAGSVSMSVGFLGLIIGATFAGLVYVVLALVVRKAGVNWINKLMPPVVIGPTVAIIGLSLAGNAIGDFKSGGLKDIAKNSICSPYIAIICGLVTLFTVIICSVYGKKMFKLIPFIIGILAGYVVAAIFTGIGYIAEVDALKVIDFTKFKNMQWYPDFTFVEAFKGDYYYGANGANFGSYLVSIAVAYAPVAFVVFAEHIADHENLSSIIGKELLKDPGLHRTLLGDGVGSIAGAFFGGCPNTTYGESVACVAITGNASVVTILTTAIMAILASFVAPFVTFLATIPNCVMGGVCITLYGFIAVSGLKMIQKVDLGDNSNLFVVSVILICGIGGLTLNFGSVTITEVACALILGIVANLVCSKARKTSTDDCENCSEDKTEENCAACKASKEEAAVADSDKQ